MQRPTPPAETKTQTGDMTLMQTASPKPPSSFYCLLQIAGPRVFTRRLHQPGRKVSSVQSDQGCTAVGRARGLRHGLRQSPSAVVLSTATAHLNQPRLHMAADDGRCNRNHPHKQLSGAGTMPPPLPSFLLFIHLTIEAPRPR